MENELLTQTYKHPLIDSTELEKLIHAHKKVSFKKRDLILKQDSIANGYLILESGLIRSYVNDYKGNDITTEFFSSKDIVIEAISLFQRIPSTENIQALTNCQCWELDFDVFQSLYHTIPGFSEWGRIWMAKSLFKLKKRSLEMVTVSAKERYLQLIKEKPQIILQSPLKNIASYLGITDSSFSRIRKEISR